MKYQITGLLFVFVLFTQVKTQAQHRLHIGEQIPKLTLSPVIHYSSSSLNLSSFHGKLVLLDFWATWCQPCVAMLKKSEKLKQQFPGQLEIIPVSYQRKEEVDSFFTRMQRVLPLHPFSVVEDTLLSKLFPHQQLPHYVWIDPEGKILAITGAEEVTAEHIRAVLDKKELHLVTKTDPPVNQNINDPVFISPATAGLFYQTYLGGFMEDRLSFAHQDSFRIAAINQTISSMFQVSLGHMNQEYFLHNRRMFQDSALMEFSTGWSLLNSEAAWREWAKTHTYSYEQQTLSAEPLELKWDRMAREVNQFTIEHFHIKGELKNEKINCLVLHYDSSIHNLAAKGDRNDYQDSPFSFTTYNGTISELIYVLRKYLPMLDRPLIDDTHYTGKIDMELQVNFSDIKALNIELKKYGLSLKEEKWEVPMIWIHRTENIK